MEVKFTALSYQEEEMAKLVRTEAEKGMPSGYSYQPSPNDVSFKLKDLSKDGVATFVVNFKVNLTPQIKPEEIRNNLVGKKVDLGEKYLKSLPNIASYEAKITPRFPIAIATFPRVLKNINLSVEAQ